MVRLFVLNSLHIQAHPNPHLLGHLQSGNFFPQTCRNFS